MARVSPYAEAARFRRDGRAVEGARLESVCRATYRGFESHSLRQVWALEFGEDPYSDASRSDSVCFRVGIGVGVGVVTRWPGEWEEQIDSQIDG